MPPRRGVLTGWVGLHTPAGRVLVPGAIATLFVLLLARVFWHIGDEGSIVYDAQRWALGEVPYRDFFEVMGPLTFAPGAAAFKLFGVGWWASRLEMIAAAAATAMLIASLSVPRSSGLGAILAPVMYVAAVSSLWPGVNYHLDSNVGVLAAAALMAGPRGGRLRDAAAGVVSAYVALIMIQKGLLLLGSITVFMMTDARHAIRARIGHVATAAGGFAALVVLVLAYFAMHGALRNLAYATVIWPATQYHAVNRVPFGFGYGEVVGGVLGLWRDLLGGVPGTLIGVLVLVPYFAVPTLACVGILDVAVRMVRGPALSAAERVVAVIGVGLLVSESHRPDVMHVLYASPLLMMSGWNAVERRPRSVERVARTLAGAGCAALIVATSVVALSARTVVTSPVGTLRIHAPDVALDFLVRTARRGEPVLMYPWNPMYYFVGGVRNPTRYSIFMYHINTVAQARELVDDVERRQVRYVLWDTTYSGSNLTRWFPEYREPPAHEQVIEQYLSHRYADVDRLGRFRLLARSMR